MKLRVNIYFFAGLLIMATPQVFGQTVPDEVTDFDDQPKPHEEVRDITYVKNMIKNALAKAPITKVPSKQILDTPTFVSTQGGSDSEGDYWVYTVRTAVQVCTVSVPSPKAVEMAQQRIDSGVQIENEKVSHKSARIADLQASREVYRKQCEARNENQRILSESHRPPEPTGPLGQGFGGPTGMVAPEPSNVTGYIQEDCERQAYEVFEGWQQTDRASEAAAIQNGFGAPVGMEQKVLPSAKLVVCKRSADISETANQPAPVAASSASVGAVQAESNPQSTH